MRSANVADELAAGNRLSRRLAAEAGAPSVATAFEEMAEAADQLAAALRARALEVRD